MRLSAILASFSLAATTTVALAAALSPATVKLTTPLAQPNNAIIALGAAWNCSGDTCVSTIDRKSPAVRDCRQIVRAIGPVASFSVGTKSLDEAGIAACNAPTS